MINRILLSLFLLLCVSMMAKAVFAGEGSTASEVTIRLNITPRQGEAGTSITVTGSGAVPTQVVFITLSPNANTSFNALTSLEVPAAADGTFNAILTIPADIPDNLYYVRAEQFTETGSVAQYYWNTFTVGASVGAAFLPTTGRVLGTPVTMTALLATVLTLAMIGRGIYHLRTGQ